MNSKKIRLAFLLIPSVLVLLSCTAAYYYIKLFTNNAGLPVSDDSLWPLTVEDGSLTQTAASTFSNSRSTVQEEVVLGRLAVSSDPCCPDKAVPPPTVKEQNIQDRLGLLLEEYSRKHKVWRKAFLQGDNSVRTLTWTMKRGKAGGLGDRFQGITFSFALAILSDRLFLIQWTSKPFKEDFQKHLFVPRSGAIDWDVDAKLVERLDSLKNQKINIPAGKFLSSHAGHINSLKHHVIAPVSATHVEIRTNLDLFSEFMHVVSLAELKQMVNGREDKIDFMTHGNPYNDQIGSALSRQLFKYNPFLVEKASEMTRKLSITEDQPYTAVHIRTGDFGDLNEDLSKTINKNSTWQILLDCAVSRSHEILGPNTPIVLFTDSPHLKDWTSTIFRDQVKPYPGKPIHMDKMSMTRAEEIKMGAELVVMSRASILIRARFSGFSDISTRMCPFNREHVFGLAKCRKSYRLVSKH